jgi:hypothetical protein
MYDQSTVAALNTQSLSPFAGQFGAFGEPQNYSVDSLTLTQAFNVWKDTLLRLEWRHDWTDLNNNGNSNVGFSGSTAASADSRDAQDTIAVNVVYSF